MVDIFLNSDRVKKALQAYSQVKSKKDTWIQQNLSQMPIVDFTNNGFWREEFDNKVIEIDSDATDFLKGIEEMNKILDDTDSRCCMLLNRADDFYDLLDGSTPVGTYPQTLCTGVMKNLFYNSLYHDAIVEKCEDVGIRDTTEHTQLDILEGLIPTFEYLPSNTLASEIEAIRKDIEKQKNVVVFQESFEQYAIEVKDLNDVIGYSLDGIVDTTINVPEATRTFDFAHLNMSNAQKSRIWFAEYVDDEYKLTYCEVAKLDQYITDIYYVYDKASGPAKDLFEQYKGRIKFASMTVPGTDASYHCGGYLYINLAENVKNPKGRANTFYHEMGHCIVYHTDARNSQEMADFDDALKKGVTAYIDKMEATEKAKLLANGYVEGTPAYEQMLRDKTRIAIEADLHSQLGTNHGAYDGVTDMIDAASNHKYTIGFTHLNSDKGYKWPSNTSTYWDRDPDAQSDEAFAEMFAADMMGDQKELDFIRNNFTDGTVNVYDRYVDLRTYMIQEGAN